MAGLGQHGECLSGAVGAVTEHLQLLGLGGQQFDADDGVVAVCAVGHAS